jgi:CHAD domain-containing protein
MVLAAERGELIFTKTERELLRLRKGYQPELVHRFRTTTRRLQVFLDELMPTPGRNEKKLLKDLRRIRRRAGRIRDIDVQIAALRSLKVPLEPRRKTLLLQRLLELRQKQEKRLGKLLNKKEVAEIHKRLKRASRKPKLEANNGLDLARRILASASLGNARVDESQLHKYRILVKRARYAAEFAPKSAEVERFIAQLKAVQDALGRWHDWFTLTQTAMQHLGDIHQSSLVAALHNVTRGKFREALAGLTTLPGATAPLRLVPSRRQSPQAPPLLERTGTAA